MKRRIPYIVLCIVLFLTELFIALFIKGGFIRYHLGDVIVIWLCYSFVQIITGGRYKYRTAFGVLVFAFAVEFLQAIHIVDILGLGDSAFFRTLIGTSFSVADLWCYVAGTAVNILCILLCKKLFADKNTAGAE